MKNTFNRDDLNDIFLRNFIGGEIPRLIFKMMNDERFNYPPYNIVKIDDNKFMIELAVAGFSEAELNVVVENESLKITGNPDRSQDEDKSYWYKGIGKRRFQQVLVLDKHVKVTSAKLDKGVLQIHLERKVPEEMRPQMVAIESA